MKLRNSPITLISLMAFAVVLNACGKTTRTSSTSANASVSTYTATSTMTSTYTYTDTSTSTNTNTSGSDAPYSFEFTLNGNQVAQTPPIPTDHVLKVRFRVTPDQGNNVWKASELNVTLTVNGTDFTPTYTSSNYVYGQVGETSNLIDLSGVVPAGQSVAITIKNPKNDFYCTYWGGLNADGSYVNPQYGSYPGCRKAVFYNHHWSGVLLVQTSNTTAL